MSSACRRWARTGGSRYHSNALRAVPAVALDQASAVHTKVCQSSTAQLQDHGTALTAPITLLILVLAAVIATVAGVDGLYRPPMPACRRQTLHLRLLPQCTTPVKRCGQRRMRQCREKPGRSNGTVTTTTASGDIIWNLCPIGMPRKN